MIGKCILICFRFLIYPQIIGLRHPGVAFWKYSATNTERPHDHFTHWPWKLLCTVRGRYPEVGRLGAGDCESDNGNHARYLRPASNLPEYLGQSHGLQLPCGLALPMVYGEILPLNWTATKICNLVVNYEKRTQKIQCQLQS